MGYNRLFENPDYLYINNRRKYWNDTVTLPFSYYKDKLYLGYPNTTHLSLVNEIPIYYKGDSRGIYSGRLFFEYKVISFWHFPESKAKLMKVLNDIQDEYNNVLYNELNGDSINEFDKEFREKINLIDGEWKIEIPVTEDISNFIKYPDTEDEDNNYPQWDVIHQKNIKYISPNEYNKGFIRSEEELEQEHVKSPLLKQSKVVQGFGSEHPEYQTKQAWKRMAPIGDSKQEKKYSKLYECPDNITYKNKYYSFIGNTLPFGVLFKDGKLIKIKVGLHEGETHKEAEISSFHYRYLGRLFLDPKVLTFWNYPSKEEIYLFIKEVKNIYNIDLLKDNWRIEIYDKHSNNSFVLINNYLKKEIESENPSTKEYEEHLKSPLLKKHKVIQGFGSEHPEYQKKQAWKRAVPIGDNKIEKFYPSLKLNESPDSIYINNKHFSYNDKLSYPFAVVLNTDIMDIVSVVIGVEGTDHGASKLVKSLAPWKQYVYPGRLFLEEKVITFWNYPNKEELVFILNNISKQTDIKFLEDNWKIEIYPKAETGQLGYMQNIRDKDEDEDEDEEDIEKSDNENGNSIIVNINDYFKSDMISQDAPEEEYLEHIKSPLLKKQKVVQGFGSQHPEYQKKQAWKRAIPMGDSKQENNFYPKLNE
ncbi:hypothetical protein M0Q50_06965 [bacterium]|jgi:hypothetical protein|nr:hypothetical protein [bacterium]